MQLQAVPGFLGGSADLGPSNKTELKGRVIFQMEEIFTLVLKNTQWLQWLMLMNLYGLFRVYSATFLYFLII